MHLSQGIIVAGRYRLERQLGVGGMGEVWAATQTLTRKPVALKFLRDASASPEVRRRFLREARAVCAVRHPNVVQIYDVLEVEGGEPVMVMELLDGESLEQRLRRDGRLALGDLAALMLRVVSAVGTAHALGIVHRDLKPDNIFLAQTPEGVEVKVLDFGIAKLTALDGDAAETGGLTNTGAMLGTPYYMSPEQAFGEKKVDHRADIWSLGIILYRGLSGVLPTQADNIGQILKIIMMNAIPPLGDVAPGLPADVVALVTRMLSPDPGARPQDLQEIKATLERHAGIVVEGFGSPAEHEPIAIAVTAAAPSAGRRTWAAVAALTVAVVVALVVLARPSGAPPRAEPTAAATTPPGAPTSSAEVGVASTAAPSGTPTAPAGDAPPTLPVAKASATSAPSATSRSATHSPATPVPVTKAGEAPKEAATGSIGGVIVKPPF